MDREPAPAASECGPVAPAAYRALCEAIAIAAENDFDRPSSADEAVVGGFLSQLLGSGIPGDDLDVAVGPDGTIGLLIAAPGGSIAVELQAGAERFEMSVTGDSPWYARDLPQDEALAQIERHRRQ